MIALSIKNRGVYDQIGSREISLSEFTTFSKKLSLLNEDSGSGVFWWATLLYLGTFANQPLEKLEQEFQKLGVWDPSDKEEGAFREELSRFGEAFGRRGRAHDSVFSKIYQTLEELKTFASR